MKADLRRKKAKRLAVINTKNIAREERKRELARSKWGKKVLCSGSTGQ